MAKLGQLVIELAANTARLQSDMGKAVGIAERGAAQIKNAFSFVTSGVSGGLIATALIGAARQASQFGDELNKAATKAGVGGKAISELAYAAKLADVDLASLSIALKKMQVALSEASTGNKQVKLALDALGISLQQIQRLKPEDQFALIGDRISKLKDPADRARAATELFGKAGSDLLPLFEQGAAGISKAREEAEKLGASFSDDTLKRLSEFDDAGKRLGASWDAFATTITAKVAPAITSLLDSFSGTRSAELRQQIAFLEKVQGEGFVSANLLGKAGAYKDIGTGVFSADEGAAMLSRLQAQLDLIESSKYNLGGRGRGGTAPGFASADAATKAAEASKKAAEAEAKEMQKFVDGYHESLRDMNADVDRESDALLHKDLDRWMDRQDAANETYEKWKQGEKDVAVWREQQWQQSAQVFRDYFVNAIEDMINTGKFEWRGFLTFIVAELAKRKIGQLLDSIFANAGSNGGWLSTVISAVGGAYSGSSGAPIDGKASGGPVQGGRTYLVGERGMELFRPGTSGTIVPNHALGGGPNVTVVNHIDARGATVDAIKLLPSFGKQISDMTEARIVSRLHRDYYGLKQ